MIIKLTVILVLVSCQLVGAQSLFAKFPICVSTNINAYMKNYPGSVPVQNTFNILNPIICPIGYKRICLLDPDTGAPGTGILYTCSGACPGFCAPDCTNPDALKGQMAIPIQSDGDPCDLSSHKHVCYNDNEPGFCILRNPVYPGYSGK